MLMNNMRHLDLHDKYNRMREETAADKLRFLCEQEHFDAAFVSYYSSTMYRLIRELDQEINTRPIRDSKC